MAEISVSAVIIESEDGSYRSQCPELGVEARGESADDALDNLKEAIQKKIRETGPDNLQLNPVKCLRIKISLD